MNVPVAELEVQVLRCIHTVHGNGQNENSNGLVAAICAQRQDGVW